MQCSHAHNRSSAADRMRIPRGGRFNTCWSAACSFLETPAGRQTLWLIWSKVSYCYKTLMRTPAMPLCPIKLVWLEKIQACLKIAKSPRWIIDIIYISLWMIWKSSSLLIIRVHTDLITAQWWKGPESEIKCDRVFELLCQIYIKHFSFVVL